MINTLTHFAELIGYVILMFMSVSWTIVAVCFLVYLAHEGGNIWKSFERWLNDKD